MNFLFSQTLTLHESHGKDSDFYSKSNGKSLNGFKPRIDDGESISSDGESEQLITANSYINYNHLF